MFDREISEEEKTRIKKLHDGDEDVGAIAKQLAKLGLLNQIAVTADTYMLSEFISAAVVVFSNWLAKELRHPESELSDQTKNPAYLLATKIQLQFQHVQHQHKTTLSSMIDVDVVLLKRDYSINSLSDTRLKNDLKALERHLKQVNGKVEHVIDQGASLSVAPPSVASPVAAPARDLIQEKIDEMQGVRGDSKQDKRDYRQVLLELEDLTEGASVEDKTKIRDFLRGQASNGLVHYRKFFGSSTPTIYKRLLHQVSAATPVVASPASQRRQPQQQTLPEQVAELVEKLEAIKRAVSAANLQERKTTKHERKMDSILLKSYKIEFVSVLKSYNRVIKAQVEAFKSATNTDQVVGDAAAETGGFARLVEAVTGRDPTAQKPKKKSFFSRRNKVAVVDESTKKAPEFLDWHRATLYNHGPFSFFASRGKTDSRQDVNDILRSAGYEPKT